MSSQHWINISQATTSANSTLLSYPSLVSWRQPPLPSVTDKQSERDLNRLDAKLSPVEWLTRQIDDVCRLAAFA